MSRAWLPFFSPPVAAVLAACAIAAMLWPLGAWLWSWARARRQPA